MTGEPAKTRRKRGGVSRKRRLLIGASVLVLLGVAGAVTASLVRRKLLGESIWELHDRAATAFAAGDHETTAAIARRILEQRPTDRNARFTLGAALLGLGRDAEGWVEIEQVAADDPSHVQAQLALVRRAVREDREDEAVTRLRAVVATANPPVESYAVLGGLLRSRGDAAGALAAYETLAGDDRADTELRIDAALRAARLHGLRAPFHRDEQVERAREREGYQSARELARTLLERGGDDAIRAQGYLARIDLALGKPNEALASCDAALGVTTDAAERVTLRTLRAQIYAVLGDVDEARRELDGALSDTPDPPADALLAAADFHTSRRDETAALPYLRRGVELYPRDEEIGLALVRTLFSSGDAAGAEAEARRLADALPSSVRVLLRLAGLRRLRGDVAGSRAAYTAAAELAPDDLVVQVRLADAAFADAGQSPTVDEALLDEAERRAASVLEHEPGNVDALIVSAKVVLARADALDRKAHEAAAKLLRTAVDRDPFSLEAHTFLAWADYLRGRPAEAVLGLERVLNVLPEERAPLRLLLARALLAAGDPARAVDAAERGLAVAPDDPGGLRTLVDALRSLGRIGDALVALGRLQQAEPDAIVHVLLQAQLRGETGDVTGAEERFARAEELAAAIADPDRALDEQVRVTQARAAYHQRAGDVAAAKGAFASLLSRTDGNAASHVRYGEFLLAVGQEVEAEREFQLAIAKEPDAIAPRRALADLWFHRRKVTPELETLIETIDRAHRGEPVVDYLRAKLAFLRGDLLVSVDLMLRYLEVRPDDPDGHHAAGVMLTRAGRFEEAVQHMQRASSLLPESAEARVALARTRFAWAEDLVRRGRNREAQAALRQAQREDPGAVEPRTLLARSLALGGDVDLSEREIRVLLARDPDDLVARRMLASVHAVKGDFDRAAVELERLLQKAPEDWTAWTMLATVELERGRPQPALAAARKAREAAPDEPSSMAAVVQVLIETGATEQARSEVDALLAADARAPYLRYLAAVIAERQGRFGDVVARCREALDLEPAFAAALRLATSALAGPLRDEAGAYTEAAVRAERAPESLEMQHLHASFAWRAGKADDALRRLRNLVERDPPYLPAVTLLSSVLADRGEATAARDVLTRAIDVFPDVGELHFLVGESFLRQAVARTGSSVVPEPERGLALAAYEAADRLRPNYPPTLNALAWLLLQDPSRLQEALERIHAAVSLAPDYVPYLDTEGMVLLALGRAEPAVELYARALGLLERQEAELANDERAAHHDPRQLAARRKRLDRTRAEVREHYEQARTAAETR